jgi:hypothetical protein
MQGARVMEHGRFGRLVGVFFIYIKTYRLFLPFKFFGKRIIGVILNEFIFIILIFIDIISFNCYNPCFCKILALKLG